jgi:hypothetical protein
MRSAVVVLAMSTTILTGVGRGTAPDRRSLHFVGGFQLSSRVIADLAASSTA